MKWITSFVQDEFEDISSKVTRLDQNGYLEKGPIPIIDQGEKFISGYHQDHKLAFKEELPVILFGDHTRILKYIDFPFIRGADGVKVLRPKKLVPKFAFYCLQHLNLPSSGYSRHFKFLKENLIKYPNSRDEQKRIAKILDQADRLRRLRRHASQQADTFLQSVFIEMFGDPIENPKKWVIMKIDEIKSDKPYSLIGGPFGSDLVSTDYVIKGIPVIRGTNLSQQIIQNVDNDFVFVTAAKAEQLSRNKAYPNDIIFTQRGTLGQVAWIAPHCGIKEFIISQSQMKLTCNEDKVLPVFVYSLFRMPSVIKMVEDSALITGVPHSNLGILKNYTIIIPPLDKQKEFGFIFHKVASLTIKNKEAERQADLNFQAILHKAFTGQFVQEEICV